MAIPVLTANSPVSGSIAWGGFNIQYGGTSYSVSSGSTAQKFVWWRYNGGSPLLQAGVEPPQDLSLDDLLLFGNKNGTPINLQTAGLVEGGLIIDGSILADALSANSVTAEKILAGTIDATKILANSLDASVIATNAITADELAANAVTAAKILAGEIDASKLKAHSITADRLLVGSFDNLVSDPQFIATQAGTVAAWVLSSGSFVANASRGANTPTARIAGGGNYVLSAIGVPADPAQSYQHQVWIKPTLAAAAAYIQLGLNCFSANGTYIGGVVGPAPALTAATWSRVTLQMGQGTAYPLIAGTASVQLYVMNYTGGNADVDFVGLTRAGNGELIVDGSITATKIGADEINGTHIAANSVDATQIVADYLYAGQVSADQISSGTLSAAVQLIIGAGSGFTVSPPTVDGNGKNVGGLVIQDPDNPSGDPLIQLHPNGSLFKGKVITDILTVMQDLIINGNGTISSGATMTLKNGVSDPVEPVLTTGTIDNTAWPTTPASHTVRGLTWDATNNQWVQLLWASGTTTAKIRTISTAGVAGSLISLAPGGSASKTMVSGICATGNGVYVGFRLGTSPDPDWQIYRFNQTTGAKQATASLDWLDESPYGMTVQLATDGTYVYATPGQNNDVGNPIEIWRFNASDLGIPGGLGTPNNAYIAGGTFDTGRKAISLNVGNLDRGTPLVQLTDTLGNVRHWTFPATWTNTAMTVATAHDFTVNAGNYVVYKSTGGTTPEPTGMYAYNGSTVLSRLSNYFPAVSEQWYVKYQDKGTAPKTTALSPVKSIAVPARRFLTATLRPAPAGVTGADIYVGYGTSLPPNANFFRRTEAVVNRSMQMTQGKVATPGGGVLGTYTITNRVATTTTITFTTSAAHGLQPGQTVNVGMSVPDARFDGVGVITGQTSTTFTINSAGAAVATAALGGTVTAILLNTLGGSPSQLLTEAGGFQLKGDGTGVWPVLEARVQTAIDTTVAAGPLLKIDSRQLSSDVNIATGSTTVLSGSVGTTVDVANSRFTYAAGVWTCTEAGYYNVIFQSGWAGNATGTRKVYIRKGSSTIATSGGGSGSTTPVYVQVQIFVKLAVGETIAFAAYQNSGGTLALTSGGDTWFQLVQVGR